ncbi:FAD-dependent oxidoreductase [Klebsiella pneumoniae]|uniref:FAD-dependent oxidoreductase n=1 Tax=Klebsiella pneumoniae TaxID=573 RepID=UPI001D0F9195|nr:FAD-dependent oxidoreductase [Klebsiella pneumoniae]
MVDVLVIGGGNAALCAALTAREAGASVLLLEAAPRSGAAATRSTRVTCAVCTMRRRTCWSTATRKKSTGRICCASPREYQRSAGPTGDPHLVTMPGLDAPARS